MKDEEDQGGRGGWTLIGEPFLGLYYNGLHTRLTTKVQEIEKDHQALANNVISINRRLENKDKHDRQREQGQEKLQKRLEALEAKLNRPKGEHGTPQGEEYNFRQLPPEGWLTVPEHLRQHKPADIGFLNDSDYKRLHKCIKQYCSPFPFRKIGADHPSNYYELVALEKGCADYVRYKLLQAPVPKKYNPKQEILDFSQQN